MPAPHRATRIALVALLVSATAFFAVGAFWERSEGEDHAESAVAAATSEASADEGAESAEERHDESAETSQSAESDEGGERLLGVDVESPVLLIVATLAGLAMALVAALSVGRRTGGDRRRMCDLGGPGRTGDRPPGR
jgi:hypothetical protein